MDEKFKWDDKILYVGSFVYIGTMIVAFLIITVLFTVFGVEFSDGFWGGLWWWYTVVMVGLSVIIATWLTIGGFVDLRALYARLAMIKRNAADDGTVVGRQSLADMSEQE